MRSRPGEGAEFQIYLPAAPDEPGPILENETVPVPGGTETILLTEDEPALREKIRGILESAGYCVMAARDGPEALGLALADRYPIDLLLTDVVMPGLPGPEVARRMQPLRPGMKVLYMSGYPSPGGTPGTFPEAADFLAKPFTREGLLRRVRRALDRRSVATTG